MALLAVTEPASTNGLADRVALLALLAGADTAAEVCSGIFVDDVTGMLGNSGAVSARSVRLRSERKRPQST